MHWWGCTCDSVSLTRIKQCVLYGAKTKLATAAAREFSGVEIGLLVCLEQTWTGSFFTGFVVWCECTCCYTPTRTWIQESFSLIYSPVCQVRYSSQTGRTSGISRLHTRALRLSFWHNISSQCVEALMGSAMCLFKSPNPETLYKRSPLR